MSVIARIDNSEIKGLAAAKLWIDFSKQPEAQGEAACFRCFTASRKAAAAGGREARGAKVDEEMQDGLLSVKACRDAGDADGLVALAATDNLAWTGSPMLVCAAAEGLIAMRKITEALKVLDSVEKAFPKACGPSNSAGWRWREAGRP